MMKAKTFLVVGGFALCLLSGCTHYESEPTFGKVPDHFVTRKWMR